MHAEPKALRAIVDRRVLILISALLVALPLLVALSGCSCSPAPKQTADEKQKTDRLKEKEKPKPDFEVEEMVILPPDSTLPPRATKPGHWFSAKQQFKSNKADFLSGELESFSGRQQNAEMFDIEDTNYRLRIVRPAVLPKGQNKNFDLTYFSPTHRGHDLGAVWLYNNLRYAGGGSRLQNPPQLTNRMKSFQNFMVVLSKRPDRYTFLKVSRTVNPPVDDMTTQDRSNRDYYVVIPSTERGVDLPANVMSWTTTAYVFWDDFDATILTRDQKTAFLDWLNWGGQLIVSGPDSMDQLKTSFLDDYLPAKAGKVYPLDSSSLAELNENWSLKPRKAKKDMKLALLDGTQEAIKLEPHADGTFVEGTGELVAERRIGRGRIVVTGFRITGREFLNWGSFDSFLNGCLLRRPPREYRASHLSGVISLWAGSFSEDELPTRGSDSLRRPRRLFAGDPSAQIDPNQDSFNPADYAGSNRLSFEPLLTSKLRIFSRDASSSRYGGSRSKKLHLDVDGYGYDRQSGVAGWNDRSHCATLVRDLLNRSAGIEVPDANLILATLGFYLLILVPVNWVIFKLLGRVEWAWIAVPILALIGTYAVVRLAQLDIGFARSRTEIGILETQPNYDRAHLTRFTGLYTSLSASYELAFDDSTSVAQPFATGQTLGPGMDKQIVTMRLGGQSNADESEKVSRARVRLQGFSVSSNNTGMVHSEQVLDCSGPLQIVEERAGRYKLLNNTAFVIKDIGVIHRNGSEILQGWVGDLKPNQTRTFQFSQKLIYDAATESSFQIGRPEITSFNERKRERLTENEDDEESEEKEPEVEFAEWDASDVAGKGSSDDLQIRALLNLAADKRRLNDGDIRMVGWTDQEMPGLEIKPRASQKTLRTIVVGNLRYGQLPTPRGDVNVYEDYLDDPLTP